MSLAAKNALVSKTKKLHYIYRDHVNKAKQIYILGTSSSTVQLKNDLEKDSKNLSGVRNLSKLYGLKFITPHS